MCRKLRQLLTCGRADDWRVGQTEVTPVRDEPFGRVGVSNDIKQNLGTRNGSARSISRDSRTKGIYSAD